MRLTLLVYDNDKYLDRKSFIDAKKVEYEIEGFRVITGEEAWQIESETDESCIDPCHEYLELAFINGTTCTFRNSFVDLFRLH